MDFILVEFYGDPDDSPVLIGLFSDDELADIAIEKSITDMRKHNVGYERLCTISDYSKTTLIVNKQIFL